MTAAGGAPPARFDGPLLIAGSAAFSISTMFSAMKPVLITRFVEQAGYSPGLAGLAAAMPFAGGALSSLALPVLFRRLPVGTAITVFGAGLALAEAANAVWFAQPLPLLAGQFAAGLCGGVLMGVLSRLIAVSSRSEQAFGMVDMAGVLMMSFMIALAGWAVEWNGLRGAFLAAAALSTVFAGTMHLCGSRLAQPAPCAQDREQAGFAIAWKPFAIILMGVLFVTFSGLGFAFMVTAARGLGFGYDEASAWIGIILFLSAAGCLTGGWFAARFGATLPLLAAFAICAAGWHVALHTHDRLIFLCGLGPAIFALQFCFPVLLALAGSVDAEGRTAAIAAPLIVSGFAWAAIVAGLVVDRWGIAALPRATSAGMIVCAVLLLSSAAMPGGRAIAAEPA